MKIIDLEQGTPEWLSWRKTVITATDCSCIMGNNPWTSAYQCWQRKLDLVEELKSNEAMERGKRLEPEARAQFIERYGIQMQPIVVESTEFNFLGASLDGISSIGSHILEIKCGGLNLHKMAEQGEIPQYYLDQMQHQLLVTRAEKAFYYSYNGQDGICIEVLPDPTFADRFLPKAREFLRCIAFNEPPPLRDSDYRDMTNTSHWKGYADMYKNISAQIKSLEEIKEGYRKELIKLTGDHSCKGDGIKVIKTHVKGRVAYDDIPELKDVDLEKYRKPSSTCWKILTDDKS